MADQRDTLEQEHRAEVQRIRVRTLVDDALVSKKETTTVTSSTAVSSLSIRTETQSKECLSSKGPTGPPRPRRGWGRGRGGPRGSPRPSGGGGLSFLDQIRSNKDKKFVEFSGSVYQKLNSTSTPPKRKSTKEPKKGGLLDEIRNAKKKSKLKKARATPKKKPVRMGILDQIRSIGETKEATGKGDLASQASALLQQRKDRLTVPTDVINLTKQINTLHEPINKLNADIKRTERVIRTYLLYDKAGKCKAKLVEYEAKLAKQSAELLEKSAEVAAKFLEKRCEKQKGSELLEAQSLLALIEQALVETKVEEIELVKQEEFALAGEKKKEVANLVKMSFALDCIVSFVVIVMFLNSFCFRDYFFSLFF